MSSFNVIRKHSSDSTGIRIKELTQELARQRSQLAGSQLETDDVRSMGRMDHSTIKINDERLKFLTTLNSANTDFFYEFPTEPDFNFLKVWFMLDHLGTRIRDMSGFGNDGIVTGHPTLRRESIDMGFQQTTPNTPASPAMLFNMGTDVVSQFNGEYIWIPDNPSIQFTQFSAGFSIAFRFVCYNFNDHIPAAFPDSTYARRFAAKTDNATNGWNLIVYPTNAQGTEGGVEFEILHNNTQYARRTTGYSIANWYQVVVTYNPNVAADQRIKIYTAGIENSLSSTYGTSLPVHTNLRIGARDVETGFFQGFIHDFRLYMGKVLTQTEITNLNQNELTIDNIPKGRSFVIQYALVSQAMRSKTHKYNVAGKSTTKVTRTRTHRFNMIGKIVRTRTHKFNITGQPTTPVSRTRTHKWNILTRVSRTRTHKYNVTAGSSLTLIYDVDGVGTTSIFGGAGNNSKHGLEITSFLSDLAGKAPKQIVVKMRKFGSPTGTLYVRMANATDTVQTEFGSMDVSTLSSIATEYTFTNSGATAAISSGYRIYVEFTGGNSSNHVRAYTSGSNVKTNVRYTRNTVGTGWSGFDSDDFVAKIYE